MSIAAALRPFSLRGLLRHVLRCFTTAMLDGLRDAIDAIRVERLRRELPRFLASELARADTVAELESNAPVARILIDAELDTDWGFSRWDTAGVRVHHTDGTVSTDIYLEETGAACECLGRLADLRPPLPTDRMVVALTDQQFPAVCTVCDNPRCSKPEASATDWCTACRSLTAPQHRDHRWGTCPSFTI